MLIHVDVTGRGYDAAAGLRSLELGADADVGVALAAARARLGECVLSPATLVFVNGKHMGTFASFGNATLRDGDKLLLLQPVAGG